MGTAIKHPVPDRVKLSFVIFDIRALWRSALSVRESGCQKLQREPASGCFIKVIDWNTCNDFPDSRTELTNFILPTSLREIGLTKNFR